MSESPDFDAQDQAEALDESNTVGGEGDVGLGGESPFRVGEDMRTFEELPDLLDLTRADGDRDEDEALALDADEFDEDAVDDNDTEEDDELNYRAATAEREDDIDGLGPEDGFAEDRHPASDVAGLSLVADADAVEGGEDDVTNFESDGADDEDLQELGYGEAGVRNVNEP